MRSLAILFTAVILLGPGTAKADVTADIVDHVSCYPRGLDQIGAKADADGIAIWQACYAPDFSFRLDLGWGAPTICTPDECGIPGQSAIAKRAAFARGVYDRAGFVRTHHSLANHHVVVTDAENASVSAQVTAVHFGASGGTVTGYGEWSVSLELTEGGWRITEETLRILRSTRGN